MSLHLDTRGASGSEYTILAVVVGLVGLAAFGVLGGAQRDAIGGANSGGVPAAPMAGQAGEAPTASPPATPPNGAPPNAVTLGPSTLAGVGGQGGASGGTGEFSGGNSFSAGDQAGGRGGSGGGAGSGGGGFRIGPLRFGGTAGVAPFARTIFDGVAAPLRLGGSNLKSIVATGLGGGLGALKKVGGGGSCFNPLNTAGCIVDAVLGDDDDENKDEDGAPTADELPDPKAGDFRVLTINAANGHECSAEISEAAKKADPDAKSELETDCGGDPDYYRTKENRKRLGEVARDSQADVVALQELDVGNGRSKNLDTGLRTAARAHPALAIFLTGDPGVDYEVVGIDEECSRLPCKKISPDGTVIYLTDDGSYVAGVSICSQGSDTRCPRGTTDDPFYGSWDVADNEGYGDQVRIKGNKDCPVDANVVGDEHRRYGTGTIVGPDQEVTDAYTVVLPNDDSASPPPVGDRNALHDHNNEARLDYANMDVPKNDKGDPLVDNEPRTALVTVVKSPDGTEKVVINVHLARTGDDVQRAQLAAVAEVVAAESARGRDVVVTGDFNMQQDEVGKVFNDAGLEHASGTGIDMTWVLDGTNTVTNTDIHSDGASDHDLGATTTLR